MNFIFLVTVVLTALIFVGLVVVIANAIRCRDCQRDSAALLQSAEDGAL